MKKTTAVKKKPTVTPKKGVSAAAPKSPSFFKKIAQKIPPFFPPETSREYKLCFFSFCCGLIVMAIFFLIDLHIRSYIEMKHMEKRLNYIVQQNMEKHDLKYLHMLKEKMNNKDGVKYKKFHKKEIKGRMPEGHPVPVMPQPQEN